MVESDDDMDSLLDGLPRALLYSYRHTGRLAGSILIR